ncbi:MAG: hypothetical protein Harvfovirus29_7 [Harvfovirus sp.]|uniref:Uncharacterized protein n=1 Tax=Harvfovirus sp. TaxID=2487768 RepID=A0A3G5A2A4_9VIRU|nr:MAG: hypothetical protein Harvfovirus29_7 [Harvfovirus sp.]
MGNSTGKSIEPARVDLIKLTQLTIHTKNFKQFADILEKLPYASLLIGKECYNNLTLYHYIVLELLQYSEGEIATISAIIVANSKKLGKLNTKLPLIDNHSLIVDDVTGTYELGHVGSIVRVVSHIYDVHKYRHMNPSFWRTVDIMYLELFIDSDKYYKSFFNINGSSAQSTLDLLKNKFKDVPLGKKLNIIQDILMKVALCELQ